MFKKQKPRRGMVILVVLSLLVLFSLLVATYLIVAGQYHRAAESFGRQEMLGQDPSRLLDSAMYELVRGTDRAGSSLRSHDLLMDKYGSFTHARILTEELRNALNTNLSLDPPLAPPQWYDGGSDQRFIEFIIVNTNHPRRTGFYNGRVLTFVNGPAAGLSTRIVDYTIRDLNASDWVGIIRVLTTLSDGSIAPLPRDGNRLIINGAPFSGTGPGFNTAYNPDNPTYTPIPPEGEQYVNRLTGLTEEALLPNRMGESQENLYDRYLFGGMNEGYDAPDYQNMALGAVTELGIIPSFHRPALIRHWMNDYITVTQQSVTVTPPPAPVTRGFVWGVLHPDTAETVPANWQLNNHNPAYNPNEVIRLRRRIVFRPMPWEHPNFTGSNPAFDAALRSARQIQQALSEGPWDVDNNNDGVPDSIWIDPGFPIQTAPDGRRYRPLIAVLCTDLDGRLNLNAHGNLGHFSLPPHPESNEYPRKFTALEDLGDSLYYLQDVRLASSGSTRDLPRGQGFGPAEINLRHLLQNDNEYRTLVRGRYGPSRVPGRRGMELLAQSRFAGYPHNWWRGGPSSFGSFFDFWGVQSVGIDHRGQPWSAFIYDPRGYTNHPYGHPPGGPYHSYHDSSPYFENRDDFEESSGADVSPNILADNPYEMRLVHPGADDRAFTLAELERVLRHNDIDAVARHSRLTNSVSVLRNDPSARRAVTTHSFDPPVPGVLASAEFHANGLARPTGILDMLAHRVAREISQDVDSTQVNLIVDQLVSPDLRMGLRMDVNRRLRDDETHYEQDRRRLARHLYVLAMLLKDEGFLYLPPADDPTQDSPLFTAKMLAQWAINVVTFRDSDSIMLRFPYDPNPFTGWNPDGTHVVWGCERPELLLTEALALHDFRTTPDPNADPDVAPEPFQQSFAPQGSLFVEIYSPWTGLTGHSTGPREFYSEIDEDGNAVWYSGVKLDKTNVHDVPVWRLAITPLNVPEEPTGAAIERTIYFTRPPDDMANYDDVGSQMHFASAQIAPVLPGRYAVVGPPGATRIGHRADADPETLAGMGHTATRQIVLAPDTNPELHQVRVYNNVSPPATQAGQTVDPPTLPNPTVEQIQPAIAVPIDRVWRRDPPAPASPLSIGLSISEPLLGYPHVTDNTIWDSNYADGEGRYLAPYVSPLDWDNPYLDPTPDEPGPDADSSRSYQHGTISNHRRIHLQRLANPNAAYDPLTNPYRTIDSIPVDLHRFNGVTTQVDPFAGDVEPSLTTFQRGFVPSGDDNRQLWQTPRSTAGGIQQAENPSVHIMSQILDHTLGYLNRSYGTAYTNITQPESDFDFFNYIGSPDTTSDGGRPAFPWLVWNNRPFVTPHELLQVPRSSSARLLWDFSLRNVDDPYDTQQATFAHLLNFFHSNDERGQSPNLYRLLEYVQTRSPFIDAEIPVGSPFLPPVDRISRYRDPGKINVNTIFDSRVWEAIWNDHQRLAFQEFVADRRGYGSTDNPLELPSTDPFPSRFTRLYRPPGAAGMVPPMGPDGDVLIRRDIDGTLLRGVLSSPQNPLYANAFDDAQRDTSRNSYFAYQAIQRLPNLLTTRSNVYAIWITLGFFEVDGSGLGQELGNETGEVKRHRAFYIVDRSIPVAYETGENHNVDRAVLLRRFIE